MSRILLANTVIGAAANYSIQLDKCLDWAIEVDATVNSVGAVTANDAVAAALTLGGVTITALVNSAGSNALVGNNITVAYTTGGTAGSEVVSISALAISVQIQSGVSTVTQVRTAINASALVNTLVLATGTSSSTVASHAAAALTGGINSFVDITNSELAIVGHGMFTGQVVQLTSTGTLPTGLATSTNYYVFAASANNIQLFDTLAHALAATQNAGLFSTSTGLVAITADGTLGAVVTVTPTSVSGCSYKLQKSCSYKPIENPTATFVDLVSGESGSVITNTISSSAVSMASAIYASYDWGRVVFAIAGGTVQIAVYGNAKRVV